MGNPRQSPSGCLTTPRRVRRPRYERDRCRRPTSLAGIPPAQSGRQGGGESSFRYSRKRCNPSTAHCDSAGSVTSSHPFSIIAWPCRALQDLEGERGLDGSTRPLTRSGRTGSWRRSFFHRAQPFTISTRKAFGCVLNHRLLRFNRCVPRHRRAMPEQADRAVTAAAGRAAGVREFGGSGR